MNDLDVYIKDYSNNLSEILLLQEQKLTLKNQDMKI